MLPYIICWLFYLRENYTIGLEPITWIAKLVPIKNQQIAHQPSLYLKNDSLVVETA